MTGLAYSLKCGQETAFTKVYYLFKDKIYIFCIKWLNCPQVCEDIVQETFIRLWENKANIDPDQSLKAYIYRIAKNLILDHLRYIQRCPEDTDPPCLQNGILLEKKGVNTVDQNIFFEELKSLEKRAVSSFPKQRREIYLLSRYDELSNQEIANKLGISRNTVKTHLRLAIKHIRKSLNQR